MKRWKNPEILQIGVEKTFTGHDHFCHKTDEDPCSANSNDHSDAGNKSHIWTGIDCPDHGPGNSFCCCFKVPIS